MNRQLVAIIGAWALGLILLSVLIPGILVDKQNVVADVGTDENRLEPVATTSDYFVEQDRGLGPLDPNWSRLQVPVYLTGTGEVVRESVESYVRGVVAAEMPPEFELEALEAQAVAARTYIVRRLVTGDFSQVPVEDAWITDSIVHQAFLPWDHVRSLWGEQRFTTYEEKLTAAVQQTAGWILTYDGTPIDAAYFSTSNGQTENAEEYWQEEIPYLRSVASPWDEHLSPRYEQTFLFEADDFYAKLGVPAIPAASASPFSILEQTTGGRVKTIEIGGQQMTGREVRERLDLPSAHFSLHMVEGQIEVTTYGYGHGIGMSQYGAQGMALAGMDAEEILRHYYSGIAIERVDEVQVGADAGLNVIDFLQKQEYILP